MVPFRNLWQKREKKPTHTYLNLFVLAKLSAHFYITLHYLKEEFYTKSIKFSVPITIGLLDVLVGRINWVVSKQVVFRRKRASSLMLCVNGWLQLTYIANKQKENEGKRHFAAINIQ